MGQHHEPGPTGWSAERFETQAADLVAAAARGDDDTLKGLAAACRNAANELRAVAAVPADPWADPAITYGALLGLAETAELAARSAIPADVMRALTESSEARRIVLKIAAQPGGLIDQARIPDVTGIHRANAHPTLVKLERLGVLERQVADAKGTARTLELTNTGWAAVDMVRARGMATVEDTPSIEQLLRARAPLRTLASVMTTGEPIAAGVEVGMALTSAPEEARTILCKAAAQGLKDRDARERLQFVIGMLEGLNKEGRGSVGQAAERLRGKLSGRNDVDRSRLLLKTFKKEPLDAYEEIVSAALRDDVVRA